MSKFNFSGREFVQDPIKATNLANQGAVYITNRGRPSHVLMSIEQYYKLTGTAQNIVDAVGMSESAPDFSPVTMATFR